MIEPSFKSLLREKGIKPSALATEIGVHKSRVSRWMKTQVPAERVLEAERITGISRHELRPDVFGPAKPEQEVA